MKGNKAYKFRIYPDSLQQEMFSNTFGCTRFIYNKMLEDKEKKAAVAGEGTVK